VSAAAANDGAVSRLVLEDMPARMVEFSISHADGAGTARQVVIPASLEQGIIEVLGVQSIEEFLINPRLPATFRPQAWLDDCATEVDGKEVFDAMPALLSWDLDTAANALKHNDCDDLAVGLPACELHDGPFAVNLLCTAAIPVAAKLLGGGEVVLADLGFRTREDLRTHVSQPLWDAFRATATDAIKQRELLAQEACEHPLRERG
jgi:hypothetical protein